MRCRKAPENTRTTTPDGATPAVRSAALPGKCASHPRVFIVSDCSGFKPPYTTGGTERQLSDLALALARQDVEVSVVVRQYMHEVDGPPSADPRESGIRTMYVPPECLRKGIGWRALLPNLQFILNTMLLLLRTRRDYDVLIISGFRQLALPIAFLSALAGKHCIVRVENFWDLDDELSPESNARIGRAARLLTSTIIRASRRMTFALADLVVAFSEPLQARLAELGAPPGKVELVPNGVDIARFAPVPLAAKQALRRDLDLPRDKTILVYTGRICRSKGLPEVLRAWAHCAQHDDSYLLLVGSALGSHESCEDEARELAERHPGRVKLTGAVENVEQYLQASDIFIFLSHGEAFGVSILEAVATGLPCIVSDVGCVQQLVRHHESGSIVPVRADPKTILREIRWLQSHRNLWGLMGARGRAGVVTNYALKTVARRYLELFRISCRSRSACPDQA